MKNKKVKIPQYLVQGKNRNCSVLVFPKKKWLWAYYEPFDERYEIDGDAAACQQLKYALAVLMANPSKIAYFPIRGEGYGEYYQKNYDAVLVRPELQLRRSEWVSLRRQLDKSHQIKSFELRYEPEKLYNRYQNLEKSEGEMAKIWRRKDRSVVKLEDDTVFFSLRKEICLGYHHASMHTMGYNQEYGSADEYADYVCDMGWLITAGCKRQMKAVTNFFYQR